MNVTRREFTKQASLIALSSLACAHLAKAKTIYTVRKGDTLGHIAQRHGVSTAELRRTNRLSGDMIGVGQKLSIPNQSAASTAAAGTGNRYLVQSGDTLGAIALSHGISVGDLKRANNVSSDVIRIGQTLRIPAISSTKDFLSHVRVATAKITVRRNHWQRIVVHHSAIKYGNAKKYDAAHRQRGMQNGLAYHFLIGNGIDSGDGEIEIGPRWTNQLLGGHLKSYELNLTAIGICFVGNFEQTQPSKKQLAAFTQLMDWLQGDVLQKNTQFAGHKELKGEQTICPGKHFPLAAMHARYD